MTQHALFSPSSTEANLACSGRIPLIKHLAADRDSGHSVFSAEGTAIHALSEMALRIKHQEKTDPAHMLKAAVGRKWGEFADLGDPWDDEEVTNVMVWQAQEYLAAAADFIGPQDKIHIEARVTLSPALFGTIDLLIEKPNGDVVLIDLKSGSGKEVQAYKNPQLMSYASCYAHENPPAPTNDTRRFTLVIIQPPFDPMVSTYETTEKAVREHTEALLGVMYEIEHGITSRHAGTHCQYCPAKAACPTLINAARDVATRPADGLNPEQWNEMLELAKQVKPWIEGVKARAQELAIEGMEIPGHKLVQGYGRKTWENKIAAAHALEEELAKTSEGDDLVIYNDPVLRTPTQLINECKKVLKKDFVNSLTITPERGVILTTADDKREAIAPLKGRIQALGKSLKASGV